MYPFINHNQNDVISKMFWKNLHTLFYTLEDYVSRIIDAEQYLKFKKDDEETEKRLTKQLEEMLSEKSKYDTSYKSDEEWDALIESYRDKRILTKKMVDAFVKKVTLDRDGNAIVELIYDDFLKDLVSYAKEREVQDEE